MSAIPTISGGLCQTLKDKCLENDFGTENGLYSPIGSKFINQYENNDSGFEGLYEKMNVETDDLVLKDTFATAATTGYKNNGSSVIMLQLLKKTHLSLTKKSKTTSTLKLALLMPLVSTIILIFIYLKDSFATECSEIIGLLFNVIIYLLCSYLRN